MLPADHTPMAARIEGQPSTFTAPKSARQDCLAPDNARSRPITADNQGRLSSSRRILTTGEVAARLKVSPRTIRELAERWHDTGGAEGLRGKKVGSKLWRFWDQDVEDFMSS